MKKILYSYAFIKTLSDNNADYIDSFWPLMVQIFPENKELALYAVQKTCRDELQIQIPSHPLEFILQRAKKQGYINKNVRDRYSLTKNGIEFKHNLEPERKIQRDINALLEDIKHYFESHNLSITTEEISDLLEVMLKRNFEPLIQFFHTKQDIPEFDTSSIDSRENLLIAYIIEAERDKPILFKTIEEMFYGSLISTLLYSEEPEKSFEIKKKGFSHCDVYLDTNFIFSLLDLHRTPESTQSAKELFQLMKDFNFQIKVFSFTIDEIVRVISGYVEGREGYQIDEDNIYSTLRKKRWKKSDITTFISNIEKTLKDLGISIENVADFDSSSYLPKNTSLKTQLESYKNWYTSFSINHDLAAIEKIQEIRGKPIRNIEEIKALFLTSDARLKNFNLNRMGHRDNKTICEVFLDRLLTTMLWLINPKINLSLSTIISAHSKGLFTKWHVFDQFFKIVNEMEKEGKINEEQINALFYNNYITEELGRMDDASQTHITLDFVFEKVERATISKGKSIEERQILQNEVEKYRKESETILKNITARTHSIFVIIKILLVIVPLSFIAINYFVTQNIGWLAGFSLLVALLTLIGHFFGPISQKIDNLEKYVSNTRYNRLKMENIKFNQ
jgi:hypothetical protein